MFSRRTPASLEPNRLSEALARRRAQGLPLLDLTVSNPTHVGLEYPEAAVLAALNDSRVLRYDPMPQGLPAAREAVSTWHTQQGLEADPAFLTLAGSTSEAYGWLFKLLCEPGDSILVPRPSYPLFDCLATLDSVRIHSYPLLEEMGWGIDLAELERSIDPRTRAIVLVNPNNPTGTYLKSHEWIRLQELAAHRGLALISDEVFLDYAWAPDPSRVSSLQGPHIALTFTLSGLSKVAGLPQVKLGWIHAAGPEPLRSEALQRLEWIADAYLPVSATAQCAAAGLLEAAPAIQQAIRSRALTNLSALRAAIAPESGWRVLPSEGGWNAILEAPRIYSEEEWVLLALESHGVWLQPGFFYDFDREAFLVASLLPETQVVTQALEQLGFLR